MEVLQVLLIHASLTSWLELMSRIQQEGDSPEERVKVRLRRVQKEIGQYLLVKKCNIYISKYSYASNS